jgi:hypothetical protein
MYIIYKFNNLYVGLLKVKYIETDDNYYALFVTGQLDIDANWDEYMLDIDAEGLTKVIEIKQAAYDRCLANTK